MVQPNAAAQAKAQAAAALEAEEARKIEVER